jgi:hypothetical protein
MSSSGIKLPFTNDDFKLLHELHNHYSSNENKSNSATKINESDIAEKLKLLFNYIQQSNDTIDDWNTAITKNNYELLNTLTNIYNYIQFKSTNNDNINDFASFTNTPSYHCLQSLYLLLSLNPSTYVNSIATNTSSQIRIQIKNLTFYDCFEDINLGYDIIKYIEMV